MAVPWQNHVAVPPPSGPHPDSPPQGPGVKRFLNPCATIYLAFTLPLLLTLAVVTPPWQNPDEPLHMARIVQIAHGGLLGSRAWGTAGGDSDAAIYAAYRPVQHAAMHPEQRLTRQDLQASNAVRWSARTAYTSFPNTAQYPPVFYLPGALAYWAGRAGALSIDRTLLLVRILNATLFAAAAAASLAIARRTRPFLAAILLLPTSLSLACAAGQDSLLFVSTALAVALLDRIITQERAATHAESRAIAALLVCVAAARPPYAGFLLALLLLTPKPGRATLALIAASAALVVTWCLLTVWLVSVKLGGADMHAQLASLSADPRQIPAIVAHTIRRSTLEYWRQFIGVLGWTDTPLPTAYLIAQTVVLALAAASAAGSTRLRRAPLAGTLFAAAAIFVLQYLTWSWPGQDEITGVLGRYFIPLGIILALALPGRRIPYMRHATWAAIILTAAVTPAIMIHVELTRYFLL